MHISHLTFAAGPDGLLAEVERLEELLGERFRDGGFHPRFGTRNHILPLREGRYIEVVEALDHPAAEKAPFGRAVRARTAQGGGWLGWIISVDEPLEPMAERLGCQIVYGSRKFPDGRQLEWNQIGVEELLVNPQLPYFIKWISEPDVRPSALPGKIKLKRIAIAGNRSQVATWIGTDFTDRLDGIQMKFTEPYSQTGVISATFKTPRGLVKI